AVRAAVADGGHDLAGQPLACRRAAEDGALDVGLPGGPGNHSDRETPPRAVLVRVGDARGHVRAGPAAPAGGVGAVRVLLADVAVPIGADREVGDGREDVGVDLVRRAGQLPVGQEAEDLATEAPGGGEVD